MVLHSIEHGDLSDAKKGWRDGGEPVDAVAELDKPRKCEQGDRDEDRAHVGEREAVVGKGFAVIERRELVVNGVDARDEEEDGGEEAEARAEIELAHLFRVEVVGHFGVGLAC